MPCCQQRTLETMEYVVEGDSVVVRLDPGDEVIESLKTLRAEAEIENGFFTGIGAVGHVVLGHYDVDTQEYTEEAFEGQFEVTSFLGDIGPDKVHAHIELGRDDYSTFGGHCSGATVSGTFELKITLGETALVHERDDRTGLDVFQL